MEKKIAILFYSKGNNTKLVAKRIYDVFREFMPNNVHLEMLEAQDVVHQDLLNYDAYIIGSPDYFGYVAGYIKVFFDEMYDVRKKISQRPAFGFISHGGGGKAVKSLEILMKSLSFDVILPSLSVEGATMGTKVDKQIQKSCMEILEKIK